MSLHKKEVPGIDIMSPRCSTTLSANGIARLNFSGQAVSIFGSVGPSQGPYAVQLDSSIPIVFNAENTQFLSHQLLFRADSLGPGQHTVALSNRPDKIGQALDIDLAVVTEAKVVTPPNSSSSHALATNVDFQPTPVANENGSARCVFCI